MTLIRVAIISCVPPSTWDIQEYTCDETSMTVSFSLYWRWWGLSSFHMSLHQPETYRSAPILWPLWLLASVSIDVDEGCHHFICPSINQTRTRVHLHLNLYNCELQSLLTLMRYDISNVPSSTWVIQEYTYTVTTITVSISLYWHWWGLASFHMSLHLPEANRIASILRPPQLLATVAIDIDEGCHHFICPSLNLRHTGAHAYWDLHNC